MSIRLAAFLARLRANVSSLGNRLFAQLAPSRNRKIPPLSNRELRFLLAKLSQSRSRGARSLKEQDRLTATLAQQTPEELSTLFEEHRIPWLRSLVLEALYRFPGSQLGRLFDGSQCVALKQRLIRPMICDSRAMPASRLIAMLELAQERRDMEALFDAFLDRAHPSETSLVQSRSTLKDPNASYEEKCLAAVALSRDSGPETSDALSLTASTSQELALVRLSVLSLWHIGDDRSLAKLKELGGMGRDDIRLLIDEIASFAAWSSRASSLIVQSTPAALRELITMLHSDSLIASEAAAHVLIDSHDDAVLDHLVEALRGHPNLESGIRLVEILVAREERHGPDVDPRTARALLDLLMRYPTGCLGAQAAESLGRLGVREALEPLLEALDSYDDNIRWKAVVGLRGIGRKEALPRLRTVAVKDDSEIVRSAAKEAVSFLDG